MKIGMNDPCPCGSGKKYKKCCRLTEYRVNKLKQELDVLYESRTYQYIRNLYSRFFINPYRTSNIPKCQFVFCFFVLFWFGFLVFFFCLFVFLGGFLFVFLLIFIIEKVVLWWIVGFIVLLSVVILANFVYPTLIAPLFNKFTPLDDENLKARIESLLNTIGFKSNGIFVIDASRRDGRLNAYFGGLGKNKRVVLFDTLLDKISADGLIAILGHELGHFKHKDILKNIAIMACVLFVLFFIVGHLPPQLFDALSLAHNGAGILIVMLLISPMIAFWFMPLIGYFSREAEYAADEFGANLSSKHCLADALVCLVNENKSFPSSHPAYIFFYYTHPPLLQRLKALDYDM